MKGKELLKSILKELPNLDSYLSKVISYAYRENILICNPVVSRNPFSSSLLFRVGSQPKGDKIENGWKRVFVKLTVYYFKNPAYLFFFCTHFIAFRISRLRFNKKMVDKSKDIILINTFTMIDKIYPKGKFDDPYFGSLYKIMDERNRQYVILCFLFGDRPWNLERRVQTYNILADDARNFVTEFELMGLREWFDLFKFILFYPFETLKLTPQKFGKFGQVLRDELINTLDSIQFPNYVRYLVGRKLGSLTHEKLKVIGWYENQVIDKLLFRGIRESGINSVIYGCQFYVKYPLWTNFYPLLEEMKQNVLPDVILVSGKYNLNENSDLNIKLGISPRYNYLFDIEPDKDINRREGLLVLLTYDIEESKRIIKIVENYHTKNSTDHITIKLHPNHVSIQPFIYPSDWKYSEDNLTSLCLTSSVVITSGSSTALESAAMGCSVIIVGNDDGLTFNPMPEYGRGRIWDMVFNAEELEQAIEKLIRYRNENPGEIVTMAQELRNMFFTEATEEKFIDLFEL